MGGCRAGIGFAAAAMLAALPHPAWAGDAPLRADVARTALVTASAESLPPSASPSELQLAAIPSARADDGFTQSAPQQDGAEVSDAGSGGSSQPDWHYWRLLGLLILALLLIAWLVELRVRARTRKLSTQERALRRRDQMLATSQRLAHIGSWEVDPATLRMTWTEETFRIAGLPPEQGAPDVERFFEMVEPDDLPMMRAALESILAGGPDLNLVFRLRRPDGTVRYIHERAEAEHDRHGRVRLLHGAVQDITDWRELDEHVHAFQELLEGSEELCGVCDNEFRYIWVNSAYCRWFRQERSAIIGRPLAEVIDSEEFERDIRPALERCLTGKPQRLETMRRDGEGIARPILARYYPLLDAEGKVVRIGAVLSDISELKAAESRAQEQAHLVDMAGRAARLGAWSVELPDMQPIWSDFMAEIHGMPPGIRPLWRRRSTSTPPSTANASRRSIRPASSRAKPSMRSSRSSTPTTSVSGSGPSAKRSAMRRGASSGCRVRCRTSPRASKPKTRPPGSRRTCARP